MLVVRGKKQIRWVVTLVVVAAMVMYLYARRGGAQQEGPTPHTVGAEQEPLSKEDLKDIADERAHSPEIATRLKLPKVGGVWALDKYDGTDELAALRQPGTMADGDSQHYVDMVEVNPASVAHRLTELKGAVARVQLHSANVKFYVRVGNEVPEDAEPHDYWVDTHGAVEENKQVANPKSLYAIERLDVRSDVREVNTFRIAKLGVGAQTNLIATTRTLLPGGLWIELKPMMALDPGEYVLIEVLNNHAMNREVWEFGVHADAAKNVNVIDPLPDPNKVRPVLKEREKEAETD